MLRFKRGIQYAAASPFTHYCLWDRHRGVEVVSTSPATPPGVRVRTGRFDGLRSTGQFGDSQPFEEVVRQRHVERHRRVVPPAPAVGGNPSGCFGRYPASDQLAVNDLAAPPVLELHRPEAVTNPTIDVGERPRRVREPEVCPPALEIRPERFAHLCEASSGTAPG